MKTVKCPEDLITSKQATVIGFQLQAVEKRTRAEDYIQVADHFRKAVKSQSINSHNDLICDSKLKEFVVATCFLSQKSQRHLSDDIIVKMIKNQINLDELRNDDYVLELERKYFLSCGETLGGTLRNLVGQIAQIKLSNLIFKTARSFHQNVREILGNKEKIKGISWDKNKDKRTIVFDMKPKFMEKSVDIILLKCGESEITSALGDPSQYLLAGELKGGIDPAGADEHWKTANAALDRIRNAFVEKNIESPPLVFIGAAIEQAMANELFARIESGRFYAANFTKKDQLEEVVDYMVNV